MFRPCLRWILATLLLVPVLSPAAEASERLPRERLLLECGATVVDPGESYWIELTSFESGFVYIYSVDSRGQVSLLYPRLPEDGRGEVVEGERLRLEPIKAGRLSGIETLVAVHTREYRRIGPSRLSFLAPDPGDIEDINARLTRQGRELEAWTSLQLEVAAAPTSAEEIGVTVEVHHHHHHYRHHYDYWCPWCDCWHPTCTPGHCWCGYQVVLHYHRWYRYSHCGFWGPRHSWWTPPLVYIYREGGSAWDYDTRPWRPREAWQRHRGSSERWRERVRPRMPERDDWAEFRPEVDPPSPPSKPLRDLLRETPAEPAPASATVWDTRSMEQRRRVPAATAPAPSTGREDPATRQNPKPGSLQPGNKAPAPTTARPPAKVQPAPRGATAPSAGRRAPAPALKPAPAPVPKAAPAPPPRPTPKAPPAPAKPVPAPAKEDPGTSGSKG
jgi:hypothetical protein